MISRIIGFVVGWRELSAEGEDRAAFANLVEQSGERIFMSRFADERFKARATNSAAKRLYALCEARGISVTLSPLRGLGGVLWRYRRRYGFFLGAALMVALTFVSRDFIWDVEVVGNERVPDAEIVAGLDALGVRPGAYIPDIDFALVANDFLLASDDVAWISVNMRSSLAVVEVLEREKPQPGRFADRPRYGAANLIAAEDGEIVLPSVVSGKCLVSPGDVVQKGELLATGEITLRNDSVVYEYAAGEVTAKVFREIRIAVPLEGTRKVYTGEETERKIVKIFGKSKNLFSNGGNCYEEYDTIISEQKVSVFGSVTLPITVRTETLREYRVEPYTRTEDEARLLAESERREALERLLAEGEIASLERTDDFDGEMYTITERVYLITDIAEVSEIKEEDRKTNDTENNND